MLAAGQAGVEHKQQYTGCNNHEYRVEHTSLFVYKFLPENQDDASKYHCLQSHRLAGMSLFHKYLH
jgi:hypothetical protein